MNSVQLVGNLARDPEYGMTPGGVAYCRFTVACQRCFANQQGVREADFINCVAWRQTADFVNRYFIKGNKIGLTGSIQTRSYDAQDGSKRYVTEVIADNIEFVVPRQDSRGHASYSDHGINPPSAAQQPHNEPQRMNMDDFTEVDDDELPF